MDNLTEIYDSETPTDEEVQESLDLATAGQILQKMAEEEGIDLDSLSEQDLAELLVELRGEEQSGNITPEQTKRASIMMENEYQQIPENLTYADVAAELAKIAQREGIDLDEVSREEYHQAFDKLAQDMSQPDYFERQVEFHEKLAEADTMGRVMARAFVDELNEGEKIARYNPFNVYSMSRRVGMSRRQAARKALMGLEDAVSTGTGRLFRGGQKGETQRAAQSVLESNVPEQYRAMAHRLAKQDERYQSRRLGRILLGGTAAGTATVGGVAAYRGYKKKKAGDEVEAAALELARNILAENGIDPDTGEKLASVDDVVEERAWEILKEAGWV